MDRTTYWLNRKAGKRGQGEMPKPVLVSVKAGSHLMQVGNTMQMVNRATARGAK